MTRQWFIADAGLGESLWTTVRRLPPHTGVLVLAGQMHLLSRLRRLGRQRGVIVEVERPGRVARVHNLRELRRALLRRTPLILLSPVHPTLSHPDWKPIPRMRAAAMARLADRRLVALGGMDARKFRRVERLGFQAWAGISAWREGPSRERIA